MNYIIAGMKHCGKSTIGKHLADYLNASFYDTDDLVEELYNKRDNRALSARDIFIEHDSEFFKKMESDVLHKLNDVILPKSENNVIALGGGLPVNIDLILLLHKMGTVIFLKNDIEVLYKRVEKSGVVPFLDDKNPKESFFELYKEREPYYILHADITVNLDNCSIGESWEKVLKAIKYYNKK